MRSHRFTDDNDKTACDNCSVEVRDSAIMAVDTVDGAAHVCPDCFDDLTIDMEEE